MNELEGKVAIVTGASRGIGAATATAFARAGARVVLAARSDRDIERIADEIRSDGGQAIAARCDVSAYRDVENVVDQALAAFGSINFLVNNAGVIDPIARLAESDPDAWSRVADINYKGGYHGLRAAIPVMLQQGSGVIVNISSGAATSPLEGWSHYCSTKAAVFYAYKVCRQGIQGAWHSFRWSQSRHRCYRHAGCGQGLRHQSGQPARPVRSYSSRMGRQSCFVVVR
jgi:3-oxoacyl-[acyl-carrier protein] reductase